MAKCTGDKIANGKRQIVTLLRSHHQLVTGTISAWLDLNVG
jgi:hypothetical protein